jgi:EAL domain-containing protein (putative c-di-GMP-specific phosphodiesterase class I)/putative methionine-R-sulfoxide reductase with GAF domain
MSDLAQLRLAIHESSDPMVVMRRVAEQAVALIPAAEGAAIELARGEQLTYACAVGSLAEHVGITLPFDASLSGLAARTGQTTYCEDSATDDRVDAQAAARIGDRSFVCVPLLRGSQVLGVLKVSAGRPRAFTEPDVALLSRLAGFVSAAIDAISEMSLAARALLSPRGLAAQPEITDRAVSEFVANVLQPGIVGELTARGRIKRVLGGSGLQMLCQPIVEIDTGRIVGAEALCRFAGPPRRSPHVWFDEAARVGLGVELELAAVEAALGLLEPLPEEVFLAINVGPEALAEPRLARLLDGVDARRVVIELTEHLRVDDYPQVRQALAEVRRLGVRLAIDDTGAGFASLAHIVNLTPDQIKLDRQFVHGIEADPARRAVAQSLLSLGAETGAMMIAEGVENGRELEAVRGLGIAYAQGYLFSRPCAASSLARRYPYLRVGPRIAPSERRPHGERAAGSLQPCPATKPRRGGRHGSR